MAAAAFCKVELRQIGTSTSGWQGEQWQTGFHVRYEGNPLAPLQSGTPSTYNVSTNEETETATVEATAMSIIWRQFETGIVPTPASQAKMKTIVGEVIKYWAATSQFRPVWAGLKEVRITHCTLPTGYSVASTSNRFIFDTVKPGTATGGAPPQVAAVISLIGKGSLSRRGKGRMYHGPTGSTFTGNGTLPSTCGTGLQTATKTMINAINLIPGTRVANISLANGQFYDVSQIRMGDLLDTQRRRRAQRDEVYTSVDI